MPVAQTRLEILQVAKILQSVREKDKDQIARLVLYGTPYLINYSEPNNGDTPLNIAASANDEEMLDFLIEMGAHPDVMDFRGRSAIMRAAECGHIQCVKKLVDAGADINLRDLEGRGILYYCLSSPSQRHQECFKITLNAQTDVNNAFNSGKPIFQYACENSVENEQACLELLDRGADPTSLDTTTGKTALMAAAFSGSAAVCRQIIFSGGDVNAVDKKGGHAAHYAAKNGHIDVLKVLAGGLATFDNIDSLGNTAIHYAALGHAMCIRFLWQRGCNPRPKNNEGFQAKAYAKDNGYKDCVKELKKAEKAFGKLAKNNEPWAIQLYDYCVLYQERLMPMITPYDTDNIGKLTKEEFFEALISQSVPLTEEAIKRLAMIFDPMKEGFIDYNDFFSYKKFIHKNYMHSAFEPKDKKKKKGSKGGKGKKAGKTRIPIPICVAEEGPRTEGGGPPEMFIPRHQPFTDVERFSRDKPPAHPLQDDSIWYLDPPEKSYITITDAAKANDFESLRNALQNDIDVDTRDKFYKTPLMIACAHGNIDMVKFLVENKANVNATDNFKWTPLHHACHAGQLDVVQYLIENGASLNAETMNLATPLQRAIESSSFEVVQHLIQIGANLQTENRKGMNPLDVSVQWADPRVYYCLKEKWDTLPPVDEKKKKQKKPGPAKKKPAAQAAAPAAETEGKLKGEGDDASAGDSGAEDDDFITAAAVAAAEQKRKQLERGSILRAASALAAGQGEKEDATYELKNPWVQQPTTEELIGQKHRRCERFGWEIDFEGYQMPFERNISHKLQAAEG